MTNIVLLLIALLFVFKVCIFGPFLYWVFRDDIRAYFAGRRQATRAPRCPGCGSRYAARLDEGTTRREDDELVVVTAYQCQHCAFPFWHVERVPITPAVRS